MAERVPIDLGIVGIKNRGEYDSGTAYEKLNVVTYQGSTYCALKATLGNLPTNTDYWQLYAEKGGTGPQGPKPVKGTDYFTQEDIASIENDLKPIITSNVGDEVASQLGDITSVTPLGASSMSDMIDTSRIYVLETDGHWYWYNGSTWRDGGVYQATEIADGSVTPLKTNFFSYTDILDETTLTDERLSSTGGGANANPGYHLTDFIRVTEGQKIYLDGRFDRLRYYNNNKISINELIDDTNLANREITIPTFSGNPVVYIRIDWQKSVNDVPNIHLFNMNEMKQLIPIDEIKKARKINGINYDSLYQALNESYNALASSISNDSEIYIKYTSQTQAYITIYMKCKNYYVGYIFKHMINADVNCDVWRLRDVHAYTKDANNNFTEVSGELVHSASEWECAIKETGKIFVGGSTHGYEIVTDIEFFLDSVRYDNPSELNNLTGKELRIIRKSNLYRSDDINTIIATHYVDYLFKDNSVTIDNRIDWNVNTNLGISFMTMLGLKRTNANGQVSSYGIREGDGALLDMSTIPFSYGAVKKCRKAYAFNDTLPGAKVFASVELLEDDYLPNSSFHFEGAENYNKFYFDHCGQNYDVSVGDIWHTKSKYIINYLGQIEE